VSPELFVDGVFAFEKTAALKAAVELDLFSALQAEDGKLTPTAARIGAAERGVRILCDYLTVHGFLEKERGFYRLTPSTQTFLTRSSPAYMGGITDFLAAPEMLALWLTDPAAAVRKGGSVGLAATSLENPVWVKFARAMVPFMAPIAGMMATEVDSWPQRPNRVLDIAAGHGLFGIKLAQAIPGLEVTALDWPAVLMVARENASAAKVASRFHAIEGSAFDVNWGTSYDLVLLANFLHHFDRNTCIGLLQRAKSALTTGGRVLAVEFVPNDDRVSPPFPAAFAYQMLASTPAGDAFTLKELQDMGLAAGFGRVTGKPAEPTPQTFVMFEL
jgi:ubiquinone/menaquinone biosynthesis C-methylase UbiE